MFDGSSFATYASVVLSASLVLRFLLRSYPHNYPAAMRYPHPPRPINMLLVYLVGLMSRSACLAGFPILVPFHLFSMIGGFTLINQT